jgi:hypothetical protein
MTRPLFALAVFLCACASTAVRATTSPDDVATVDGMMAAFYEARNERPHRRDVMDASAAMSAFHGAPEEPRPRSRDRALYVPWVRFVAIDSAGDVKTYDRSSFVAGTEPMFRADFRKREIARTTRRHGNIVHIDSTYETFRGLPGERRSRGVTSVELYWDGKRWWIYSVVLQSESPTSPIPPPQLSATP